MNAPPILPASAPFSESQRLWLNGYLAGLLSATGPAVASDARFASPATGPKPGLAILYGSQSGNAESLARQWARDAAQRGYDATVAELNQFGTPALDGLRQVLIVTSTWGDGDPPDNAAACWETLNAAEAPDLKGLTFGLLALGDSNYSEFCGFGRKLDARLVELGATRLCDRRDCDTDFDDPAAEWIGDAWEKLTTSPAAADPGSASMPAETVAAVAEVSQPAYDRRHPFGADLPVNQLLTVPGSGRDIRHFEIDLTGSGLSYTVGDALGVCPENDPALVERVLATLGWSADTEGEWKGERLSVGEILRTRVDIARPNRKLLALAEEGRDTTGWDLLDLLECERDLVPRDPEVLLPLFGPLQPRLYSIASSSVAHPDRVHLTVAVVRETRLDRERLGVCSTYLAERVGAEGKVPVFVQPSRHFRLPREGAVPVIMVGPGTGIAPFRGFLQERAATGATGGNWLFFGNRHPDQDYLYREELEAFQTGGVLTRLSTAFSREGASKVYVQDRMREEGATLWQWLEEGAVFYVCGDAHRMAKDVDAALHQIIQTAGGRDAEGAAAYVADLKKTHRYLRDVY